MLILNDFLKICQIFSGFMLSVWFLLRDSELNMFWFWTVYLFIYLSLMVKRQRFNMRPYCLVKSILHVIHPFDSTSPQQHVSVCSQSEGVIHIIFMAIEFMLQNVRHMPNLLVSLKGTRFCGGWFCLPYNLNGAHVRCHVWSWCTTAVRKQDSMFLNPLRHNFCFSSYARRSSRRWRRR